MSGQLVKPPNEPMKRSAAQNAFRGGGAAFALDDLVVKNR
jgi:hypothetical protein